MKSPCFVIMIEIILNKREYEYDVHALVTAMYPGKPVSFEETEGDAEGKIYIHLTETGADVRFVSGEREVTYQKELNVADETPKNVFKLFFYECLCKETGKTLPWGNLTGIRPTKIAMMLLERLNTMFRDGNVQKVYWALVCREPAEKEKLLEGMLWRNEKQNKSYICRHGSNRKDAKLARLIYRYIGKTERYFLLEVELLTGRHHQIRCQLSNIGCPIKGDLKYGAPRSNPDGGISLHARRITFIHPVRKEEMTVEAPVPTSWKGIK